MPARRPGSRVGQSLKGKWHLEAQIGTGGMATVYKASHRNGLKAAVKILHPHIAATPGMRERFLREGYVANRVEHAGAVQVLDDDEDDGTVFLVMELLEGETLKDRWSKEGQVLPLDAVLDVAQGTLDVLVAAHAKGIVHRDIKPDNVFLTTEGKIKILDFGIARLKEGTGRTHSTETGATLGTPAFMPPEQARSRWDEVDARCDIFAVGATMWTMLTGRLVHEAKTLQELLIAAATEQVKPIATVLPSLPLQVAEAIDRALRFDRNERWPDAATMRAALAVARKPKKGASKTLQMATDQAPNTVPIEAPARPPEPPAKVPGFASDSVTTKLVAEPLPPVAVSAAPASPITTPIPAPPAPPAVEAVATAVSGPVGIRASEPGLDATQPSSLATIEHAVAAEGSASDLGRSRRKLAVSAGAALAFGCAVWLGWRSVTALSSRPEPTAVAASAEVVPRNAAPAARPAPSQSVEASPPPVVEPADVAAPPSAESAAPPPGPTHAAAAAPHRPSSHPARASQPKRDPASVFATH